jgi:chromosome segregation ATPase
MRYLTVLIVSVTLLMSEPALAAASVSLIAQLQSNAQEKVANLRAQLTEVETKQSDLQTRLQTLEEKLKPENVEHDLAGVGSTHPEDLREQRRRQLEIERNGVRAQLDLLAVSHTRLERAIAQADADAYRQSATPVREPSIDPSPTTDESSGTITTPPRARRVKKKKAKRSRRLPPRLDH